MRANNLLRTVRIIIAVLFGGFVLVVGLAAGIYLFFTYSHRDRVARFGGEPRGQPIDWDHWATNSQIVRRAGSLVGGSELAPGSGLEAEPAADAASDGRSRGQPFPGDDLFHDGEIPWLEIEIERPEMRALRRNPREYVRASIRDRERVYTNVAIRLKGGPGSYRPLDDHPSFTVNFDKFADGQTFHGLKKIHLNNSVQDETYVSEKMSRELFHAAGIPAPRAGNAVVVLNGEVLGMYVLVEGVNKQFLRRYFKDAGGNVYDGHSGQDVTDEHLETNSGDDPGNHTALRALAEAVQEPNLQRRLAKVEKTLDLDRFLSFMAMEAILWHWDGYTIGRNNFRIFHDRESNRMVFFPQGMDQMLSDPRGSIFPQPAGLVARSVLEIPEVRHRYMERVAELVAGVFQPATVAARVRQTAARIGPLLEEIDPERAQAYPGRVDSLCRRIQQRASYLRRQIARVQRVKLEGDTPMLLSEWEPRIDLGEADLVREESGRGQSLLRISTRNGCTASWRTTASLDPGSYRFEARLKTAGVVFPEGDPRAGAGLRISRHRVGQKNAGDRDWTPVTFDFEVSPNQTEVELVCELRALSGDAWFDSGSLKISKR